MLLADEFCFKSPGQALTGGTGAVLVETDPVLILAGDGMVDGAVGFDSCYTAAEAAQALLHPHL